MRSEEHFRILQIAHSHPQFCTGGTEVFSHALHKEAIRRNHDSWFLGAMTDRDGKAYPGSFARAITRDHRESALHSRSFRNFELSQPDYLGFLREFRDYLAVLKPTAIHFHHILNFGLEALHVARSALPSCQIVLTLHDYYLMCANRGFLYNFSIDQRCTGPDIPKCIGCFPDRTAAQFGQRRLDIRYALNNCDVIVSPSVLLQKKFEEYLHPLKAIFVENCSLYAKSPKLGSPGQPKDNISIGYFGNISKLKGLTELLDAVDILSLSKPGKFTVNIFGSQLNPDETISSRIQASKERHGDNVRTHGKYEPPDIGKLLDEVDCVVFPSIWLENAPLVVYEAIAAQKQIIAYPGGGAEEILTRYGYGVLAEECRPQALADALRKSIDEPTKARRAGRRQVPTIDKVYEHYLELYQERTRIP